MERGILMNLKLKKVTYDIDAFSKEYYSLKEEDRDINTWVPVLEKFIWSMVNKYQNLLNVPTNKTTLSLDDMYQIAWIAVSKAIPKYKPDKNFKFTTFIGRCIDNEFKMIARQRMKTFIDREDESKGYFRFAWLDEPIKDMDGHKSNALLRDIIEVSLLNIVWQVVYSLNKLYNFEKSWDKFSVPYKKSINTWFSKW